LSTKEIFQINRTEIERSLRENFNPLEKLNFLKVTITMKRIFNNRNF